MKDVFLRFLGVITAITALFLIGDFVYNFSIDIFSEGYEDIRLLWFLCCVAISFATVVYKS